MRKIGITGTIACGKSTIGRMIADQGFPVLDLDDVVHELYDTPAVKDAIQSRFGLDAFTPGGAVDRRRLARFAFDNFEILHWLERLLWPHVIQETELWFFRQERSHPTAVFVLGSHLFASGLSQQLDQIWQVTTTSELALERVQRRYRIDRQYATVRLGSSRDPQLDPAQITRIFTNTKTLADARQAVIKTLQDCNLLPTKPS